MTPSQQLDRFVLELKTLRFKEPVAYVYNPLEYARESYDTYLNRFGKAPKEVVFLGMNPGPWGMAQTGVPFGEINLVRSWLGIEKPVGKPDREHPKRPIEGFACQKSEVSGRRVWEWAKGRFGSPDLFFDRFFVLNYCPLVFMEEGGRNRTPDKLPKSEKKCLFELCDDFLRQMVLHLNPTYVIGVGVFAEKRAFEALRGFDLTIGRITHPSPANPQANRGWSERVEKELAGLNIAGF
jgi:single-strand selective monofunctional uracil DNA glycosylase